MNPAQEISDLLAMAHKEAVRVATILAQSHGYEIAVTMPVVAMLPKPMLTIERDDE